MWIRTQGPASGTRARRRSVARENGGNAITTSIAPRVLSARFVLILSFVAASATATTYTVTNTADSGAGSLRQAITDANTAAGTDTIAFNIPGSGVHTIEVPSL